MKRVCPLADQKTRQDGETKVWKQGKDERARQGRLGPEVLHFWYGRAAR
jgi:hypothetical protein